MREYLAVLDDAAFGARHAGRCRSSSRLPIRPRAGPRPRRAGPSIAYCDQLSDRPGARRHRRCRGDDRGARRPRSRAAQAMIDRTQDQFGLWPERWWPTPAMARPRTWPGWCMNAASSRTSRCSTSPHARDGSLLARRLRLRPRSAIPTSVRAASSCGSSSRQLHMPRNGVDDDGFMRYRARKLDCDACSLKAAMLPERARPQGPPLDPRRCPRHGPRYRDHRRLSSSPAASGRRSRCCSPTSSAS